VLRVLLGPTSRLPLHYTTRQTYYSGNRNPRQDFLFFIFILFIYKLYQFKAGAPLREGSELSLKRVKREQKEEEAGNQRGLSATEEILVHGPLLRSTTLSPTAFRVFVGVLPNFGSTTDEFRRLYPSQYSFTTPVKLRVIGTMLRSLLFALWRTNLQH
jgi:hypothetical protein